VNATPDAMFFKRRFVRATRNPEVVQVRGVEIAAKMFGLTSQAQTGGDPYAQSRCLSIA
jgi:hypothetical protein